LVSPLPCGKGIACSSLALHPVSSLLAQLCLLEEWAASQTPTVLYLLPPQRGTIMVENKSVAHSARAFHTVNI